MDSDRLIIENLRSIVGLNVMLNFAGLGRVRQSRLEQMLDAVADHLSIKNMGSIYMKWLFQREFDASGFYRSQVIERWVSFVNARGLKVDEAIAMWAHAVSDPSTATLGLEQTKNVNDLWKELEAKFYKLENQRPTSRLKLSTTTSTGHNSYADVYDRDFDISRKRSRHLGYGEETLESGWTLKNWPTRDVPFPSTESPANTEQEEVEFISSDEEEEQTEEPAAKRLRPFPQRNNRAPVRLRLFRQQIPNSSQSESTPRSNTQGKSGKMDLRNVLNY